jgi:hypothetical protein
VKNTRHAGLELLKERNRSRDLAELSSSSDNNVGSSIDTRTDSFALSELIALVMGTQGSAKPPHLG